MGGGDCFIKGTQIDTLKGTVNIEDVEIGDRVLTYDLEKGKIQAQEVNGTMTQRHSGEGSDFLVIIEFANGMTNVNTNTHPFYIKGIGWASWLPEETKRKYDLTVAQLQVGDTALFFDGEGISETLVSSIKEDRRATITYNLHDVEANHNFFANGILVHNKGGDSGSGNATGRGGNSGSNTGGSGGNVGTGTGGSSGSDADFAGISADINAGEPAGAPEGAADNDADNAATDAALSSGMSFGDFGTSTDGQQTGGDVDTSDSDSFGQSDTTMASVQGMLPFAAIIPTAKAIATAISLGQDIIGLFGGEEDGDDASTDGEDAGAPPGSADNDADNAATDAALGLGGLNDGSDSGEGAFGLGDLGTGGGGHLPGFGGLISGGDEGEGNASQGGYDPYGGPDTIYGNDDKDGNNNRGGGTDQDSETPVVAPPVGDGDAPDPGQNLEADYLEELRRRREDRFGYFETRQFGPGGAKVKVETAAGEGGFGELDIQSADEDIEFIFG